MLQTLPIAHKTFPDKVFRTMRYIKVLITPFSSSSSGVANSNISVDQESNINKQRELGLRNSKRREAVENLWVHAMFKRARGIWIQSTHCGEQRIVLVDLQFFRKSQKSRFICDIFLFGTMWTKTNKQKQNQEPTVPMYVRTSDLGSAHTCMYA